MATSFLPRARQHRRTASQANRLLERQSPFYHARPPIYRRWLPSSHRQRAWIALCVCSAFLTYIALSSPTPASSVFPTVFLPDKASATREGRGIVERKVAFAIKATPLKKNPTRDRSNASKVAKIIAEAKRAPLSSSSLGVLTRAEEVAALVVFLVSSESNHLSTSIDPALPLDPDSVLDLSLPISPDARAKVLHELQSECWDTWPVVVLGRKAQPASEKVRRLFRHERYFGRFGHGMGDIELASRADAEIVLALFSRLTGLETLPLILIGGVPIGSWSEIEALDNTGDLAPLLVEAGAGAVIGLERKERLEYEGKTEEEARAEEDDDDTDDEYDGIY